MTPKDLHSIRTTLYSKAERRWSWSLGLNAVVLAVNVLAVFLAPAPETTVALAIAALVVPGIVLYLRERAAKQATDADRIRRLILVSDGLGAQVPHTERAWANGLVRKEDLKAASFIEPFFNSKMSPGPRRLADDIHESAYFTSAYSGNVVRFLATFLVVVGGLSIVSLIVLVNAFQGTNTLEIGARILVLVVSLGISGDVVLLLTKFMTMKRQADDAFTRTDVLRRQPGTTLEEVLSILGDYNAIKVQCPPIPLLVHTKRMEEVNDDYRSGQSI